MFLCMWFNATTNPVNSPLSFLSISLSLSLSFFYFPLLNFLVISWHFLSYFLFLSAISVLTHFIRLLSPQSQMEELVEQLLHNLKVSGSIPRLGPILIDSNIIGVFIWILVTIVHGPSYRLGDWLLPIKGISSSTSKVSDMNTLVDSLATWKCCY